MLSSLHLQMDRRIDITDVTVPQTVQFSYSVEWYPEQIEWKDRLTRYTESGFVPTSFEIHWLSIINSFVLVLLLTAFLTIIMFRILKNDFSKYMDLDDGALEEEEVHVSCCVRQPFFHASHVCFRYLTFVLP